MLHIEPAFPVRSLGGMEIINQRRADKLGDLAPNAWTGPGQRTCPVQGNGSGWVGIAPAAAVGWHNRWLVGFDLDGTDLWLSSAAAQELSWKGQYERMWILNFLSSLLHLQNIPGWKQFQQAIPL